MQVTVFVFLLFLSHCVSVVIFLTSGKYTPGNQTPDQICDDERQNLSLELNLSVGALFFTAGRQDLISIFPQGINITNVDGTLFAQNSSKLFDMLALLHTDYGFNLSYSNNTRVLPNQTPATQNISYWSGGSPTPNSVMMADINCGDFTGGTSPSGKTGRTGTSFSDGKMSCTSFLPFLCVTNITTSNNNKNTNNNNSNSNNSIFLFFTSQKYTGSIQNPDLVCQNEARSSIDGRLRNASLSQTVAVTFSSTQSSLFDLLTFASSSYIQDLYNNSIIFRKQNTLSQVLRDPFLRAIDIDELFWTGSLDDLASKITDNCNNYNAVNNSNLGMVGSLRDGLAVQRMNCSYSFRFLCIAGQGFPSITNAPSQRSPSVTSSKSPSPAPSPGKAGTGSNTTFLGNSTTISTTYNGSIINVTINPDPVLSPNGTIIIGIFDPRTDTVSPVVSVVFVGPAGVVNVSNLTRPILIQFPVIIALNDVYKVCLGEEPKTTPIIPDCKWFNPISAVWETRGCIRTNFSNNSIECACTHLTDFSTILPAYNYVPEEKILDLTMTNISVHPTGVYAVCVTLIIFLLFFLLAIRRDKMSSNSNSNEELKKKKIQKWSTFLNGNQKRSFFKLVKIGFQSRHTWFSLLFRKSGTSFQSVDRCFVALLTVFASMSMSARFHASNNTNIARLIVVVYTVLACFIPAQVLTQLFVRTGKLGFYEEWEYETKVRQPSKNRYLRYRFSPSWRYVWWALTVIAVVGMIAYVLTISMYFDQQPYFYCKGAVSAAWITTWLSAYAIVVLGVEPIRIMCVAAATYYTEDMRNVYRVSGNLSLEAVRRESTTSSELNDNHTQTLD